jgi:hypothetical protein
MTRIFLLQLADTVPANADHWGWLIGGACLVAIFLLARYQMARVERACGPGCICGGENRVHANQNVTVYVQNPQPNYQQQQQPQIVYLQAPQAQQQLPQYHTRYLSAPQQAPQSYYAGPEAHYEEHTPEAYYLPPAQQPIGHLPPPRARDIEEARRRFEREKRGRRL